MVTFPGESVDYRSARDRLPEREIDLHSFMFPRDPDDERRGPSHGETALLPVAASKA